MNALVKNNTWTLVTFPCDKKIVGCKWIFTVKYNLDGTIDRYKAKLVAKEYTQKLGINYDETFASVVKLNTMRVLISIATMKGW